MRAPLAGLVFLFAAAQASAGAWPREEGSTFLSLSYTVTTGARTLLAAMQDIRSYGSVYAEYGLTPRLTVGLDAGYGMGEDEKVGTALAFARLPVWTSAEGQRLAAELGFGLLDDDSDGRQLRIRPGLAWGRGFESRRGAGWLGLDAWAELRLPSQDVALKADATAGLKPNDDWMLIAQVQAGRYPDDGPLVRLAPSVVRRLGERTHVQLSLIGSVVGDDAMGVKLAAWFSF
jgi:hypothetical protein